MTQQVVEQTLSGAVASGGTITVAYPSNTDAGHYEDAAAHTLLAMGGKFTSPSSIALTFGTANIALVYNGATTIPSGTSIFVGLEQLGDNSSLVENDRAVGAELTIMRLGAADTADANGYVESQALTAAGVFATDTNTAGALAAAALLGVADVPRNIVGAWTNTAILTVTGTDEYGVVMTESSASGTSMAGKKAFKTITLISVNANVTGLTVGTGDVLGLPIALPQIGQCVAELENGAPPTAGTLVKAAAATATATTGDVRGTYDPNSAMNGAKAINLICALSDPTSKGVTQA
tara:strand:+ start:7677 stop:8555 length:879 start_codon:yes stop_codon:yes gene_type:complete